jgi:hypothetical protein
MSLAIIDINDSEIRAAAEGEIISRHPGYAVLKNDRIETGLNAWEISRTNPRETTNKFWSQLNQDSLIIPSRLARHNADLAYSQLMAIYEESGRPEEVIFAIPGSYNREHLSMLLGIAEACPFNAVGLVDSAIASTSAIADNGEYLHLDIHLHYTILTSIEVTDSVYRKSTKIIDNVGISEIYDSCAEYFSDLFIDQTRFDPLHHAETEQILYNLIPQTLGNLETNMEHNLDIHSNGKHFQAKFSAETLLQKLQHHYDKIYQDISGQQTCLVSDRLDVLPGFSKQLSNHVIIDEDKVFKGCLANLDKIISSDEGISLVTVLPPTLTPSIKAVTREATPVKSETQTIQTESHPTHILINHRAYALGNRPVFISEDGKISYDKTKTSNCSLHTNSKGIELMPENQASIYLNGTPLTTGATISTGDTITFPGTDITIKSIEVLK